MKRWVKIALWSVFSIGVIVLMVGVNTKVNQRLLSSPDIHIQVAGGNAFITKAELLHRLKIKGLIVENQRKEDLQIEKIESFIQSISQVKTVDVFQHVDGSWKIDVELREPIARIFNSHGETFYLDSEGFIMNTTPSHTARTVVITGEIPDKLNSISVPEIINNDSLISIHKLDDIYRISDYVCKDPLFRSLIGQMHIEKNGDFVLTPLVGDQKIIFGSALSTKQVKEKFEKLRIFYKEAMPFEGWNTYSQISLKYEDQIVCKKKKSNE